MKKFLVPFMIMICFLLLVVPAGAETSTVEISFKLGSDTAIVNGKTIQTENIYLNNGIVMVASEIFTEGFGADVNYKSTDKSVTVKYKDTTVILYLNQKKGFLNDQEVIVANGPEMKGAVIMLPAKFIAESFGADCSFDNKTKEIKIVKVIAGDKSIKDFSLILKKTVKSKVGDSYYKWSMDFPKGLKISDRSFDGTSTSFESVDGTYQIYISIFPNRNDTIDSLMNIDLNNFSGYTLVSQSKVKKDNFEYSKTVFKSDYGVWEIRNYLNDKWVYELMLKMDKYEKYINSAVNKEIMDTFSLNYQNGDQVEDLSDISEDGFRKYEDKNLKFSVEVAPEWHKDEYSDRYNTIEFVDVLNDNMGYSSSLCVNMYSFKPGYTLDDWMKNIHEYFQDNVNPEYYKIIKEENGVINGVQCKKIYYTQNFLGETIYSCDVFLLGKNYKYNVFYNLNADTYNDPEKLAVFEKALNSFKFNEPDPQKVGSLMDPYDIEESNSKIIRKNTQYKWYMELPSDFNAEVDNNDRDQVSYGNDSLLSVKMVVLNNVQLEGMIEYFDEELSKESKIGTYKEVDKKITNEKNTKIYKYTYLVEFNRMLIKIHTYFLQKNGNLYVIDITCPEMWLSEKNIKLMDEIWQSMKFE